MDLNRHELIGRTGSDPVIKTTFNGSKQAKISIATNFVYYKDEEKVEQVDWHTVTFYGKLADVCEKYVKKGALIYVSGRHTMKRVKKDDEKGTTLYSEISADKLIMLSEKKNNESLEEKIPF